MKYLITAFLLVFSISAQAAEKAYERVIASGEIRCGYAMSPPNLEKDPNTGKLYGLEQDVWAEIGKELGLKINWAEEAGWGNYIEGLKTGRYDAFCSQAWPTPGRILNTTMTRPLTYQLVYAYVRADDTRFDGGDLSKVNSKEVTIPVIDGDVTESMARNKFPNAKLDMLPQTTSATEMFLSVQTKKSDILFLAKSFFDDYDKANPGILKLVQNTEPLFVYAGRYSVNQGEYGLRDMINIALDRIIDDGRMKEMADRYSDSYYMPQIGYKE
jgi:ABC-type amino acid transport substrate-binding protein